MYLRFRQRTKNKQDGRRTHAVLLLMNCYAQCPALFAAVDHTDHLQPQSSAMPKHYTGNRRSITHPLTLLPSNILHPESIPGYEADQRDPVWHSFNNPNYMTPFNMYEMDLNGITTKNLEENIKTAYQIRRVTPDLAEAFKSFRPNLSVVDEKKSASSVDRSPSEISSYTETSATTPSDQSSVDWDAGIFTSEAYTPFKIEHIPGVNDHMFGGGGPETPEFDFEDDCATVCSHKFVNQVSFMPFRILQIQDLEQMRWLFKNPTRCCAELPDGFLTTNYGLRRAFKESLAVGMHGEDWDLITLGTLLRRGGMLDNETAWQKKVIYVEDMFPLIPEGHRLYDKDYWDALYAQGRLWEEMPEIDTWTRRVEGAYWTAV